MKNILFYSLLVLSLILVSCSNDDSFNSIESEKFSLTVFSERTALENNKIPLEFVLSDSNIYTQYIFTFNTPNGYLISNRGQIFKSGEEILISKKDYLFNTLFFVPTTIGNFNVDFSFTNFNNFTSNYTINYTIEESNFNVVFDNIFIELDSNNIFTFNFDILEKQHLQDVYSFRIKKNENISNVFLNDDSINLNNFHTLNLLKNNKLSFTKNSIGKTEIEVEIVSNNKTYKVFLYINSR